MQKVGPFFKHFGSKFTAAKLYPQPVYEYVSEGFCGGAGFSCNHYTKNVILYDKDPHVAAAWKFLIETATSQDILDIPIGVKEGTDIRTLGLSDGQATLLKQWQRTNNIGNCWTISSWGNKSGQWTANTRARVAEQIHAIKHWKFTEQWIINNLCTYFIDPPYKDNYKYGQPAIDYKELAKLCKNLRGQVIVCEGGDNPDWLPFVPLATRVTSRRGQDKNHHCKEWVWIKN